MSELRQRDGRDVGAVRARVHQAVTDGLVAEVARLGDDRLDGDDRRALAASLMSGALADEARRRLGQGLEPLGGPAEEALRADVLEAVCGDGVLGRYLADQRVTDIMGNGPANTIVQYADGHREAGAPLAADSAGMVELVRTVLRRNGSRVDANAVSVDAAMADGSRLFAILGGGVSPWPVICVRRHHLAELASLGDLHDRQMIDRGLRAFLGAAVAARCNIVVSGGPGVGKTTLARACCHDGIGTDERTVTVEDTYELGLHLDPARGGSVVPLLARPANIEGVGEVTIAELCRKALRMNPDRVIVGEVRGPEVLPMLDAMTQGSDGSMCTVHASSSRAVFARLAGYGVRSPERLRPSDVMLVLSSAVNLIVHVGRRRGDGRRVVSSVREVTGALEAEVPASNELWAPGADGRAVPTGVGPTLELGARLEDAGLDLAVIEQAWWRS